MNVNIYKGDIGIKLRARVYYPLHNAAAARLYLQKPNGRVTLPATVVDVNEGIIEYVSREGDFHASGEYNIQANIVFKNGNQVSGSSHKFFVRNYLD
jgi:carbohydrate-binding DOMON domain-containing protein